MHRKLNIWVYSVLFLLIAYLSMNFIQKESRNFASLNYSWSEEDVIKNHASIIIDSISDDYLRIKTQEKIIVLPHNTFKIENKEESYYFRYTYSIPTNDEVIFKGLIWLNKQPEITKKLYDLIETNLPIEKVNGPSIITIGDDQIFQNEAKYLRKDLKRRSNVNFIGKEKDLYGFNFEGFNEISFNYLKTNAATHTNYDVIILFLKPKGDLKNEIEDLKEYTNNIVQEEEGIKIIIITQPIYEYTSVSIKKYNEKLLQFSETNKNVTIIDLQTIFKNTPIYFRKNINELSKEGYEQLAKEVSKVL